MPAFPISRQPDALAWFDSLNGQALLSVELNAVQSALASRPAQQPWLWIASAGSMPNLSTLPPRSLALHRSGTYLDGSFRCGLPLPLPNESVGNLILQHALDDGGDQLLEECVRVLEPGGRVWLFTLNPWSPFRLRWRGSGLQSRDLAGWHLRLRRLGLQPCGVPVTGMGPIWRTASASDPKGLARQRSSRLGAAYLLQLEKRSAALIPPAPAKRQWQPGAATA